MIHCDDELRITPITTLPSCQECKYSCKLKWEGIDS